VIEAGAEWIALQPALDIAPGSALDFSRQGFVDPPAGKHGRVMVGAGGQFVFEKSPQTPRRFYGVNLCFGAHYLEAAEAERLAERLLRLGYNAVRIHHYERDLVQGTADSVTLNPAKLEQFDRLCAALKQRGLYLTTDLYVSRPVPFRDIGIDRDGSIPMDTFKILVPVHAGAWENWKRFSRALLTHRNPHTGLRYAEDPALAWLALINEGNLGNFHAEIRNWPEWTQAWNRWLARHYATRDALARTWGNELNADEDPARASVALPENLRGEGLRARDCIAFYGDTERDLVHRARVFLRDELGCRALISNANSWTYFTTDQAARAQYDYVDDHFYVDHPRFLERPWRLPSHCPNTSPVAGGAEGGRNRSFTRLLDRPFTITEYNYSGPGRFRGVGGILTGALGALQGWSGIWRFAYSHSREAILNPSRMGYFDLASDPFGQASERASLCLFLRGDLQVAPGSVAVVMTRADLEAPPRRIPSLAPGWHWLAWVTRIGTLVVDDPRAAVSPTMLLPLGWETPNGAYPADRALAVDPYRASVDQLMAALRGRGVLAADNPTDPARKIFRSETGEVLIDAPGDVLVLDTPRTAGGYGPPGQTLSASNGGVRITPEGTDATVWVSALDDQPIRRSRRLLVTHLTDLQNSGIRYAEPTRQTLLDWGQLPHLVRAGRAQVELQLAKPNAYEVWGLDLSGQRVARVPSQVEGGALRFVADVAAGSAGARLLYEVVEL
jgi:hypothetical protein